MSLIAVFILFYIDEFMQQNVKASILSRYISPFEWGLRKTNICEMTTLENWNASMKNEFEFTCFYIKYLLIYLNKLLFSCSAKYDKTCYTFFLTIF